MPWPAQVCSKSSVVCSKSSEVCSKSSQVRSKSSVVLDVLQQEGSLQEAQTVSVHIVMRAGPADLCQARLLGSTTPTIRPTPRIR